MATRGTIFLEWAMWLETTSWNSHALPEKWCCMKLGIIDQQGFRRSGPELELHSPRHKLHSKGKDMEPLNGSYFGYFARG